MPPAENAAVRAEHPLDLASVYMTPAIGFGQRLNPGTIDKELMRLPLRPVLQGCAVVAHLADTSIHNRAAQLELAEAMLPASVAERGLLALQQSRKLVPFSSQAAMSLALRALATCPDEGDPPPDLDRRLGRLLLAMADHLGTSLSDPDLLLLELTRLGLFYKLHGQFDWYATAASLFFETMPAMANHHEFVDVNDVTQRLAGMSIDKLWALNAAMGIYALGATKVPSFPLAVSGPSVDQELVDTWHRMNTMSIPEARVDAQRDLDSGAPWSLTTFFRRPILEIWPNAHHPIRTNLLAAKATTSGMFYLVFDLLREAGEDHMKWASFMGHAVEANGRMLLETMLPAGVEVTAPDQQAAGTGNAPKACDAVIHDGTDLVALDFVHHNLTLATQTAGSPKDLARDLRMAVVQKLEQVDTTLARELPARGQARRIFPLIVSGAPMPMSPLAHNALQQMVKADKPQVIGNDERCLPFAVLELFELRMLLATCSHNQVSMGEVLNRWLTSPLGKINFRDWLVSQDELVPGRSPIGDQWMQRMHASLGWAPPTGPQGEDHSGAPA